MSKMSKLQETEKEFQELLKDDINSVNNNKVFEIIVNEKAIGSQLTQNSNSSPISKEEQIRQNLLNEYMESIKNNKEISLSGIKIGEKEAIILAEAIKINTIATSVLIGSNSCEKGALKYIIEALKTKTNLSSIQIFGGTINRPIHSLDEFKYLAEVFESNKNLVYVNINGNNIPDAAISAIIKSLKSSSNSVCRVEIEQHHIKNNDAKAIAELIEASKNLNSVILRNNNIEKEGFSIIIKALAINESVNSIDLRVNCSMDAELATNMAKVLEVNKTLNIIKFNGNKTDNKAIKIICDGLKKNDSLVSIEMYRRDEIDDEGLSYLTDMLEVNTTLTYIVLYSHTVRRWDELKHQPIKSALDRNISMLKFVAEFVYNAPAYNSKSKIDIANISKFILYQKLNKSSLYSAIDKLVNKDDFVMDSNYNRPIDFRILKKMEGIEEYIKNYYYSFEEIFYLKGVCKDINGQSKSLLSILPEEVQAMIVELMGPKENIWQVGLKRIKEKIESKQNDIEKTEAEASSNKLTEQNQEQKIANASDILSADNKNNSGDNSTTIANNSNHPYDSPQTQNEVNKVKNQTNTQQVEEKDKNKQVNENEYILNNLRDFARRGKFEEIKPIVDKLPVEQFKEIVQTHGYNNWNLIHYAADRRVAETLEIFHSKLKDDEDLFFNLLKEQDKFGRTPYNIAKHDDKDNFYKKLEQILNSAYIDEKTKKDIINLGYNQRELLYEQKSEESEKILADKIREEMKNNKNNLPYFEDIRKAIELDCNNLAIEMIKELKDGIKVKLKTKEAQKEKKLFFASHEDYGWNLLHFVATKGDTNILKTLCEFDLELTQKMSREQNEDGKYPYDIAQEKHYDEFCNEVKGLMGEEFNNNLTV